MGGVDRVDQQLHAILRKSYKWYKKLAFRLIMQMTLNSFRIFQNFTHQKSFPYLSFLHDAIVLMISTTPDVPRLICEPGTDLPDRLTGRHFPSQKQAVEGSKDPRPTKNAEFAVHDI